VEQDQKLMWMSGVLLEGLAAPTDRVCLLVNPSAGLLSLMAPLGGSRFRAYVGIFKAPGLKPLSGHQAMTDFVKASICAGAPAAWFEHLSVAGPLACFEAADRWIRHPYRNGIALIGDAAASNDPSFGCGLSLTLRDVRVLRDRLLEDNDWKQAADAYAADHDGYYGALHRLTGWMRTLANDPRPEAAAIRAKVLPIIANDPSVFPISADLDPRPQAMTWRIGVYSEICKRFP
jgi:2-polyprenyl-6-methoxyphenol hydroxylase-like FAD-dependent oxidoreductase